jgi:ATP-dependent protease ClpP protease subunit
MKNRVHTIRAAAKTKSADMYIYGTIGEDFWSEGITNSMVAAALAELDGVDELNVHIDSPGGDAAQGISIYNLLSNHPVHVNTIVDGWAASAASIIMQAGDNRSCAENGMVMIHDAWAFSMGNKTDMRKMADILDKLDGTLAATYAARSGVKTQAEFATMMTAETWMTCQEAMDCGLCDSMMAAKAPADSVDPLRASAIAARFKFAAAYKHAPKDGDNMLELMRMRLALARIA